MLELTWWEKLERLHASKMSLEEALDAMRPMEEVWDLTGLLEASKAQIDEMTRETHRRIETLDSREARALAREYYRNLI